MTINTVADYLHSAAKFTNVENITINDDGVAHSLTGNGGAETINGNGGDDTITGGAGADTLNGGDGTTASY